MSGLAQNLAAVSPHLAGMTALPLLFGIPLPWRKASPPERAAILTLVGLAVMDLLVWRIGAGSALLHFVADALALSWMLPVALRANRFYPAIIAAALLVAVLAQLLLLIGLAQSHATVALLVNALHFVAVLTFLAGAIAHRRLLAQSINRPAWRDQLPQG